MAQSGSFWKGGAESTKHGQLAWQTLAEVLLRVQQELDREWSVEALAELAGYDVHHFAHVFRAMVGYPPSRYIRRLRLERAAFELRGLQHASILSIGLRAGYNSPEAFTRAFAAVFGVAPREFRSAGRLAADAAPEPHAAVASLPETTPTGLVLSPQIELLGDWHGYTRVVRSFDLSEVAPMMDELCRLGDAPAPWTMGALSQPWGWEVDSDFKELRCLRLVDAAAAHPPPPALLWRWSRTWFGVFQYEGDPALIAPACEWIVRRWIPNAGLRFGYAPLISLIEEWPPLLPVRARLHVPMRALR
jgi:AraC family transcriptional regulator